jgi:hypothetical protein
VFTVEPPQTDIFEARALGKATLIGFVLAESAAEAAVDAVLLHVACAENRIFVFYLQTCTPADT